MFDKFEMFIALGITIAASTLVFYQIGKNDLENKAHRAYCESIKGVPSLEGCVVDDKFVKLPEWMIEAGLVE